LWNRWKQASANYKRELGNEPQRFAGLREGENHDVSIFLDSDGVRFGDWRSSIDSQERRVLI